MRIIRRAPKCAAAYIDDGQGRRLVVASPLSGNDVLVERPVVIATNKSELDRTIRVLQSLRDELPDAAIEVTA